MPVTTVDSAQIRDGTVSRSDLNTSTVGQSVVAKIIQGANVTLSSTGADSGTGDVTITATSPRGFISKTAAYTLTTADSAKYVICSGGSWTLTLPAPAVGLFYQVRNDMGISGTTGTITLQPTSGTIDGASTLALLAAQECTIITDGTNWRTFGRQRDVVLGTQDLSNAASGIILLPPGYRYYRLLFENVVPVTSNTWLVGQLSSDGGTTWATTSYWSAAIYNSSGTAVAAQNVTGVTNMPLTNANAAANSSNLVQASDVIFWPGDGGRPPNYLATALSFGTAATGFATWLAQGLYNGGLVIANAFKYFMNSGNISVSNLTVKGAI